MQYFASFFIYYKTHVSLMGEEELVKQCYLGVNSARKELYSMYAGQMLNICYRYTGGMDVSHDLLHDGFLKVFSSFSSFTYRGNGSLKAWMSKIFVNTALEYLKKKAAFEKVAMNNYGIPTHTKVKHKFPVSAGISIRKQLTNRLALESGLLYTFLSSDLYAGEEHAHYFQEQRLHYLGIPLKLNYAFWKKERLSFYVSGGGMVEFCVDGSLRSDYYLNRIREHSGKTDLSVKRPQFSVLSSVGMQFTVIRSVSLYAEPGIAYYFDDKNKIETIRKEHPFTISVQLGLRISF